ncbi:MAG: hypothetical protein O2805_01560 [Proteobacteria bacterium]|nr:hypothetical protein [Pseudomonadota bacterium]
MKKTQRAPTALLALVCWLQAGAQDHAYALTNANLFNGVDNRVQPNVTVLVKDGRIERIAEADARIPTAYTVIDLEVLICTEM